MTRSTRTSLLHRGSALALAVLLPVQVAVVAGHDEGAEPPTALVGSDAEVAAGSVVASAATPQAAAPAPQRATDDPEEPGESVARVGGPAVRLVTETTEQVDRNARSAATTPIAATASGSADPLAERYPTQARATQDTRPATTRWALLIGINDHMGRVSDNYGSYQDAMDLRQHLLDRGWLDDHILVITDRDATGAMIRRGMDWLAAKTDERSVAIFHYSGHSKKWYGRDHDGDGEVTDEGLWPTDDAFIPDSEVVARLAGVDAGAFWVNFSTCNSAGFNDPGLARAGRLLTFSSGEGQKSYEWPDKGNSVWGYFLLDQALLAGQGDVDGNGLVTVEEAYGWATPRAHDLTVGQSHGPQDAVLIDHLQGDFRLDIPPPAAPPAGSGAPDPDGTDEGSCLLLCGGGR